MGEENENLSEISKEDIANTSTQCSKLQKCVGSHLINKARTEYVFKRIVVTREMINL